MSAHSATRTLARLTGEGAALEAIRQGVAWRTQQKRRHLSSPAFLGVHLQCQVSLAIPKALLFLPGPGLGYTLRTAHQRSCPSVFGRSCTAVVTPSGSCRIDTENPLSAESQGCRLSTGHRRFCRFEPCRTCNRNLQSHGVSRKEFHFICSTRLSQKRGNNASPAKKHRISQNEII